MNHYQSLLPQVEDNSVPEWLAQPAIDNTLQNVIRRLDEEQANLEQSSQVSFEKDNSFHQTSKSTEFILTSPAPGNNSIPAQPRHTKPAMWQQSGENGFTTFPLSNNQSHFTLVLA